MIRSPYRPRYKKLLEEYGLCDFPEEWISLLSYEKKEFLFREGFEADDFLILAEGRAKVITSTAEGRVLLHSFSCRGDMLGEVELLTDLPCAALNVQAVTPVVCIGIPIKKCRELLMENPLFLKKLSTALAQKLRLHNQNTDRIILHHLENRLCAYLELASPALLFDEPLTETAQLLGTSYRHLLRTFQKLCTQKILEKRPEGYYIKDLPALHTKGQGCYSTHLY